jgi:dipeptidyl aminopeptidase/acylaminoacyl peptidase
MKYGFIKTITCVFLSLGMGSISHADPIDIESFSRLPAITNLSLSRDGDYLVGLIAPPNDDKAWRQSIAVWDANDLSKPPVLAQPDGKVEFTFVRALKGGKILAVTRKPWTGSLGGCGEGNTIGSTKTYINKIFVTDTSLSKFEEPFNDKKINTRISEDLKMCLQMQITAGIRADLPLDKENIVITRTNNSDLSTEFLKYNLATNESHILFKSDRSSRAGLLDPRSGEILTKNSNNFKNGSVLFEIYIRETSSTAITIDPPDGKTEKNNVIYVHGKQIRKRNASFKVHDKLSYTSKSRQNVSILGVNGDGSQYYVLTDQFSDKTRIYGYDPLHEEYSKTPLFADDNYDAVDVIIGETESDFGEALGFTYAATVMKTKWVDARLESIQAQFDAKFPNKHVRIQDYSHDKSKVLVSIQSASMPPIYYLVTAGGKTTLLGSERPWINKKALTDTQLVYYTARDGRKIPGLLDLPANWKKGDPALPTVIHPHGGPWARDFGDWDISGWVPFFTSRGFAVLRPQYRGSTGWGRDHWVAGDAEWGLKMQDDKDDGAAWLVDEGIADPDKMIIMGYSYGGFAAAAAVVRPNSPYQCAIMGAGVSELDKLGATWSEDFLQRIMQGKTVKGMDPIQNTDKANIPLLVFHGDRDVRVPPYHGKKFYNKVKRKVPAKLVMIKDQPHSLPWTPKMQEKSLNAMDKFIQTECKIPLSH